MISFHFRPSEHSINSSNTTVIWMTDCRPLGCQKSGLQGKFIFVCWPLQLYHPSRFLPAKTPLNIYAPINKLSMRRREKHLCAPLCYFSECPLLLSWIYSLVALWNTIMNKWTVKFDDYCWCSPLCPAMKRNLLCIYSLPTGGNGLLQPTEAPCIFLHESP